MTAQFIVGQPLQVFVTFKDPTTGQLYDPFTPFVRSQRPNGTRLPDTNATRISTGYFSAVVTPDVDGAWKFEGFALGSKPGASPVLGVLVSPGLLAP